MEFKQKDGWNHSDCWLNHWFLKNQFQILALLSAYHIPHKQGLQKSEESGTGGLRKCFIRHNIKLRVSEHYNKPDKGVDFSGSKAGVNKI